MVHWLGLRASTAGGSGSIPGVELRSFMLCGEGEGGKGKPKIGKEFTAHNLYSEYMEGLIFR